MSQQFKNIYWTKRRAGTFTIRSFMTSVEGKIGSASATDPAEWATTIRARR